MPSAGFSQEIGGKQKMMLRHSLETLLQRTSYREIELIVIDGGELPTYTIKDLSDLTANTLGEGRWIHCSSTEKYSYSQRMNQAAKQARGEFLLQLNDDTELIEPQAIGSMLAHAQEPKIGVVGSLLLFPNGKVQHAGVAIDNLAPRHPWAGCWPKRLPPGMLSSLKSFQA